MGVRKTYMAMAIMSMGMTGQSAWAQTFSQTVNLEVENVVAGDRIHTADSIGLDSGRGTQALDLGTGALTIELTPSNLNAAALGVKLQNNAVHHLGSGSSITVDMSQGTKKAEGIVLENEAQMKAEHLTLEVKAGKSAAHGIKANKKSTVDLGSGSEIRVQGSNSQNSGINMSGADTEFKADRLKLVVSEQGSGLVVSGDNFKVDLGKGSQIESVLGAIHLRSSTVGQFQADGLSLTTHANLASGLNMNVGDITADLGSNSLVVTTGNYADAIVIASDHDSSLTAKSLSIHTSGNQAHGLNAQNGVAHLYDAQIVAEKGNGVVAQSFMPGSEAVIYLHGGSIQSGGDSAVYAQHDKATIHLDQTLIKVDRYGALDYGLWALGGGTINMHNARLEAAAGGLGIKVNSGSRVNLSGRNEIQTQGVAMDSTGKDALINARGVLIVAGDIMASKQGAVTIVADAGSEFRGGFLQGAEGRLDFSGQHSRWDMTKDSVVNALQLKDSQVSFATPVEQGFGTLSVAKLDGNGQFNLRVAIAAGEGDRLNVTESSAGEHQVSVVNQGSAQTTGDEVVTLITTPDGQAQFHLNNDVELGGYVYRLRQDENQTDWSLAAEQPEVTTTAEAAANALVAAYLANFAENQSLLKRMGDLRSGAPTQDVWARVYGGNMNAFGSGLLRGFDMDYKGLQFGLDRQVLHTEEGRLYVGGALGLLDSDQNYRRGSGSLKSYSAALYGTYLTDQHFYTDVMLKYARMKDKFDVQDSADQRVEGREHANGVSLSAEVGQRFALGQTDDQLYWTPQAQLTLSRLGGMTHRASNGLNVSVDSRHSVLARVGTEIGYQFKEVAHPTSVYAKASFLREFSSNAEYTLNDSRESHSFKGNWWQLGVGVTSQIKQQHHVYVDFELNHGQRFNQRQLNAGYRYAF